MFSNDDDDDGDNDGDRDDDGDGDDDGEDDGDDMIAESEGSISNCKQIISIPSLTSYLTLK